jgi:hypothetical protein
MINKFLNALLKFGVSINFIEASVGVHVKDVYATSVENFKTELDNEFKYNLLID